MKLKRKDFSLRPVVKFLSDDLIKQIVSEAVHILCNLGVEINNNKILSVLSDHGAIVDGRKNRLIFTEEIIEGALKTAPHSFKLYDINGNETHNFSGYNVYYTPGSTALNILDYQTKKLCKPTTDDYINYVKVISQLEHIASQSTAFIPSDVNEKISDSYRYYPKKSQEWKWRLTTQDPDHRPLASPGLDRSLPPGFRIQFCFLWILLLGIHIL